jgi:hypothetical protein
MPELGFLALARDQAPRAPIAMAQGQLDRSRQRRAHAYGSYSCEWLLADPDRVPCIPVLANITQCVPNL